MPFNVVVLGHQPLVAEVTSATTVERAEEIFNHCGCEVELFIPIDGLNHGVQAALEGLCQMHEFRLGLREVLTKVLRAGRALK